MQHKPAHQITETESHELALDSYVMHLHAHICACGATERFSQIYEVWVHPTKTRTTNYRELRPTNTLKAHLAIAVVKRNAKQIPLCEACVSKHAPAIGVKVVVSESDWQETLKRKYAAPIPEPKIAKPRTSSSGPKQKIPSLDDLKF